MKVLMIVAAALVCCFAASASAQTSPPADNASSPLSACGPLTRPPAIPDGATADNEAMTAGNAAFLAWAQPEQQSLACRRAEIEAAHARWQALSNEYNAGAQTLNTANAAWEAELAQYNGRAGGRRAASGH